VILSSYSNFYFQRSAISYVIQTLQTKHAVHRDLYIPQPTARARIVDRAVQEIHRIGSRLIEDRKAAVLAERSTNESGVVEKQDVQGHDLLSLLVKSNIAADMPENMRMSDSEILSRERFPPV
jgi:cytochrome P450